MDPRSKPFDKQCRFLSFLEKRCKFLSNAKDKNLHLYNKNSAQRSESNQRMFLSFDIFFYFFLLVTDSLATGRRNPSTI